MPSRIDQAIEALRNLSPARHEELAGYICQLAADEREPEQIDPVMVRKELGDVTSEVHAMDGVAFAPAPATPEKPKSPSPFSTPLPHVRVGGISGPAVGATSGTGTDEAAMETDDEYGPIAGVVGPEPHAASTPPAVRTPTRRPERETPRTIRTVIGFS